MELELVFHPPPWCTQRIPYTHIMYAFVTDHQKKSCKPRYAMSYLHLKSHDPAARSTLFGCQSKLRTVERMGFLMCLLTHLNTTRFIAWKTFDHRQQSTIIHSNSPVIFRLEVANRYEPRSAPHCELVLQRRPLHKCGSTVDPENNKGGFPHAVLLTPHVSVPVCSAGHDTITFGSPVNAWRENSTPDVWNLIDYMALMMFFSQLSFTCDVSIVFFQLVSFHPLVSTFLVYMDFVVIWTYSDFWKSKISIRVIIRRQTNI